jgi:hypothetical protein
LAPNGSGQSLELSLSWPIGVAPENIGDDTHALAWFEAERRVLLAITALAADNGFDDHASRLP